MRAMRFLLQFLATPLPWCIKRWVYRLSGCQFGAGAKIAPLTVVIADNIELGPHAQIKPLTIICGLKRLSMGAYAGIGNLCIINGKNSLTIGPRSYIGPGCMIDVKQDVRIGEYSGVGPRCTLMTHGVFWPFTWGLPHKSGAIDIGDLVWINFNCKIGPGIRIADRSLVLTGSVISSSVLKPAIVADSGLKRDRHPIELVHKQPSREELIEQLRQMVTGLHHDVLADDGFELHVQDGGFLLEHPKGAIYIHLHDRDEDAPQAKQHWLFGFDVDDETLSGQTGVACLDFLHFLHSPAPDRRLRRATRYFQSEWGLRFADVRYRDCFRLAPPQSIVDALAESPQTATLQRSA